MKRLLAAILLVSILMPITVFAERPSHETIALEQLALSTASSINEAFGDSTSETFDVSAEYDSDIDTIIMSIALIPFSSAQLDVIRGTETMDELISLYDSVATIANDAIDFEMSALEISLEAPTLPEVDVYIIGYSNDQIIQYVCINGRNVTSVFVQ